MNGNHLPPPRRRGQAAFCAPAVRGVAFIPFYCCKTANAINAENNAPFNSQ
jgi:hypothetical protein